jgi:uncharacterized delta-60 repeat protein
VRATTATFPSRSGFGGVLSRVRPFPALVASAAAVLLTVGVAEAGSPRTAPVPSLGVHYERTSIQSLVARPDGGFAALQGKTITAHLASGAPDPAVASGKTAGEARLFPAAGGKTLAVGYRKMTRFNPDGSVDRSFGGTGSIDPPSGAKAAYEFGSGQIAVIGTEVTGAKGPTASVSVTMLNADGSSAGGKGFSAQIPPYEFAANNWEFSPLADGSALVVGPGFMFELRRDGSANRGFGDGGLLVLPRLVGARGLADGSIEAVGTTTDNEAHSEDLALFRFGPDGKPDASFGPDGLRRFDLGGEDQANVVSWGSDGSVVVGGRSQQSGSCLEGECEEEPILAALTPTGELETGFGQNGVLRLTALAEPALGYASSGVTAMARSTDGSIVAAGNAPPNQSTGFIAALSTQGALLAGFGEGGILRSRDPRRASQETAGFVPLPEGGLLAAATTDVGAEELPVLIRYGSDGSLDPSFGGGSGYVVLHKEPGGRSHGVGGFAVDGSEVLTTTYASRSSRLLLNNTGDGSPVTSFGAGGAVVLPSEVLPLALGSGVAAKPLVLGTQQVSGSFSNEPGVVLRYQRDGTPDRRFGQRGRFTMRLGKQAVRGKAMLAGPGGRLYAAGSLGHRFAIAGLRPDGKLDPRFGSGGWAVVDAGDRTHFVTLGGIGNRIYLAGLTGETRGHQQVLLMRFDRRGHLDKSYGRDGRIAIPVKFGEAATQILPARHGVLVVLGGGHRPLVSVGANGKVRRQALDPGQGFVVNVRAAPAADGSLIVGWGEFDRAQRTIVSYFAHRPRP